jgi:DNA repair protein RadD
MNTNANNYILRNYQIKAVNDGVNFFKNKTKKNGFMVLPTGAGKSLIIANIANKLNGCVLCLQPTFELLSQNYSKFISYGNEASIYSASAGVKEIGEVTFATIGSIYKKPELFEQFRYLIVDECHLVSPDSGSMYKKFLNNVRVKLLGLTATPFRLKSYSYPDQHSKLCFLNRMRPKVFQEVIHITQIRELVNDGYWAPVKYISQPFNRDELKPNTKGSNYTEESMREALKRQGTLDQAVWMAKELYERGRDQILIFLPDIASSETVARKLGVDSISSNTKKDARARMLKDFNSGKNFAICNVNVLSVGYDNQKIDAIIDLSPTLSLARYYQKLGRGVRIDLSDNKTKEDCVVVDMVGNYDMFGRIEDLEIDLVEGKWSVVSENKILTNTPLYKDEPIPELDDEVMEFGRFKDSKFSELPRWYMNWCFKNLPNNTKNEKLFKYMRAKL